MVLTRSGTNVRRHAVRFKKGADVRRVLEYDEDDWGYELSDSESEKTDSINNAQSPAKPMVNGGILMNGTAHNAQPANGNHSSYMPSPTHSSADVTIPYDLEERKRRSWLWDALLFVIVTLFCYMAIFLLLTSWGYGLYLALATLSIIIFSYNVTYFDSTKPGIMPPSPVSPAVYRQMSGHTYHLTYLMSVINGLVFLAIEPYIRGIIVPPV